MIFYFPILVKLIIFMNRVISIQFLKIFKHSFSYGERVKINKMPPSYDLLKNMSPGHPSLRSPSKSPVLCVKMYFLKIWYYRENDFSKKSDESRANLNDMLFGCRCIRLSIKYSDVDILIIRTTTEPRQTHRKSNRCMARHSLIHQRVAQTHRHTQTQQDPPSTFNQFQLPLSTRAHMLEPNATYATGTMVSVK